MEILADYQTDAAYQEKAKQLHNEWEAEVDRIYAIRNTPLTSQGELVGAVNELGKTGKHYGVRFGFSSRRPA